MEKNETGLIKINEMTQSDVCTIIIYQNVILVSNILDKQFHSIDIKILGFCIYSLSILQLLKLIILMTLDIYIIAQNTTRQQQHFTG